MVAVRFFLRQFHLTCVQIISSSVRGGWGGGLSGHLMGKSC